MSSSKGFQAVSQAGTVLDLDRAQNARANFNAIKRIDPHASTIVSSANHCSLYQQINSQWTKMDAEGPVFLVQRDCHPAHRLVLLNRMGRNNWGLDVHSAFDFDLQHEGKYMFQDKSQSPARTYALWCPNVDVGDTSAMMKMLQDICKSSPPPDGSSAATAAAPAPRNPGSTAQIRASSAMASSSLDAKGADMSPSVAALFGSDGSGGASAAIRPASQPPLSPRQQLTSTPNAARSVQHAVTDSVADVPRGFSPAGAHPRGTAISSTPGTPQQAAGAASSSASLAQALSKQACKEALLELMQDDLFIELFHSKYKLSLTKLIKANRAALSAGAEAQE